MQEKRESADFKKKRREMSRDRILNAAKRQLGRFGYSKTAVDDICKDAKISKKTVYKIFDSKEDIFLTLFVREALIARKYVLDRVETVDDPLEKITTYFEVAREYYKQKPFMIKVLQDQDGLYAPYLKDKYRIYVEEGSLSIVSGILKDGVEKGVFREMDIRVAAFAIFKLLQAVTYAKTIQLADKTKDDEDDMRELLNLIYRGIIKNPSKSCHKKQEN